MPLHYCLRFIISAECLYVTRICLLTGEKVETFPVIEIDRKDIVDTNGAGDAFVGGTVPKALKCTEQNVNYSHSLIMTDLSPFITQIHQSVSIFVYLFIFSVMFNILANQSIHFKYTVK